jgi:toxin ParE1/3/4
MSLPIVLRFEASQDTEKARDYFDARQRGLGQIFLDRLKEIFGLISKTPEIYGVVWRNVRAAKVRKFRFVVYFRIHEDRIEVLAIMHGHRQASAWRDRA